MCVYVCVCVCVCAWERETETERERERERERSGPRPNIPLSTQSFTDILLFANSAKDENCLEGLSRKIILLSEGQMALLTWLLVMRPVSSGICQVWTASLSLCLSLFLSVCLSVSLALSVSLSLFLCPSVCLSLAISVSVCLPVCVSVSPSLAVSLCLSQHWFFPKNSYNLWDHQYGAQIR